MLEDQIDDRGNPLRQIVLLQRSGYAERQCVPDQSGRQFVVVMAGGQGSLCTKMGDSLVAYALPEGKKKAADSSAK